MPGLHARPRSSGRGSNHGIMSGRHVQGIPGSHEVSPQARPKDIPRQIAFSSGIVARHLMEVPVGCTCTYIARRTGERQYAWFLKYKNRLCAPHWQVTV